MEYLSLTGMESAFSQWAAADPNINQFGYGQFYNENGLPKVEQVYPGMWVNPIQTTPGEYALTRQYQVIIYDLVYLDSKGKSNQNSVVSDSEEIALRLIRWCRDSQEVFELEGTPQIQPMSDRWLDQVSGVIFTLTLQFNAQSETCTDPDYSFNIKTNNI